MCDFSAHEAVAHGAVLAVEADRHRTPAPTPPNRRNQGLPDPVQDHAPTPDLDQGIAKSLCLHFTSLLLLFLFTLAYTNTYQNVGCLRHMKLETFQGAINIILKTVIGCFTCKSDALLGFPWQIKVAMEVHTLCCQYKGLAM